MDPKKIYRDCGAVGALLDEYERAIGDLKSVLKTVTQKELLAIADPDTSDKDCVSIQSVLTHVVGAGYAYVVEIRNWLGEKLNHPPRPAHENIENYLQGLDEMFAYNETLFRDYPHLQLEEKDCTKKITVGWKQRYDVEQLMEHAIVHILRHRRQIERFLLKLRS